LELNKAGSKFHCPVSSPLTEKGGNRSHPSSIPPVIERVPRISNERMETAAKRIRVKEVG
jgi:hypothetical protein